MSSLRKAVSFFFSPSSVAIAMVAVASLTWASQNAGPAESDLAATRTNSCQVVAGNGKVVTQPSARCPVSIALSGPLATRSTADALNVAPGDTMARRLTITNDGKNRLDSIVMDVTPSVSDINSSLRLTVQRCSVEWSSANTCTGSGATPSTLVDGVTLPRSGVDLGASPAKAKGGVDYLLVSVLFVDSANNNTLQAKSTTIAYDLTATKS